MVRPPNISISYFYRDSANYKTFGNEVLTNPTRISLKVIEQEIKAALIDGEYFDPAAWGLTQLASESIFDADLDHSWNEFESVTETVEAPTTSMTVYEFLTRIQQAST